MEQNLQTIKAWLGTGSINIFGLPFAGKDTVGLKLAEDIGAKFLSSGLILRSMEAVDKELVHDLGAGRLASTGKFKEIILPYLTREDLRSFALILSSVGRSIGEEQDVMEALVAGGHPLKVVILINISEAMASMRWQAARVIKDRGEREDDREKQVLLTRQQEFTAKTMPVIQAYQGRGMLVQVSGRGTREEVYQRVLAAIVDFINQQNQVQENVNV